MRSDRIKTVASLVTMAGAAAVLYFSLGEAPAQVDSRPQEGLGQVLGEEAAKLLGPGGRIVLITRDTTDFKNPAAESQVSGFQRALRDAKLTISSTNLIKQDPLRVVRVPPADFIQIIRKHAEGDVIVSLLGPPILTEEQRAGLGESRPRILAVCAGATPAQVDLKQLFDQHLLHAAVISRNQAGSAAARNLREAFNQSFELITPANLSELPRLTG